MPSVSDLRKSITIESVTGALALALGLYHLAIVSGLFAVSTMEMRLTHLMLAFCLLFLTRPILTATKGTAADRVVSWLLVAATAGASLWLLSRWKDIAFSGGLTEPGDFYAGAVIVILVFEAARRGVGAILAAITLIFFLYPFVSPYLPGLLNSRGYSFERIVIFLTTDTQGVYGIPIGVAATYIIIFTIFGSLLSKFGAGDFFFELSRRLTYGMRAAGAKTAVLFSTLIGMISGSAAGNVAVTGTLTIPMMKREGYAPHQAGAIEAVVSTGGQMMPPVMGAAAFLMAEIVGVPYVQIMGVGLLPALLFFGSIFFIVHLQAVKSDIKPKAEDTGDDRSTWRVVLGGSRFIATFALLLGLMLTGYSPFKASFWAIIFLVVSELLWTRDFNFAFVRRLAAGISDGARNVAPISAACAAAGIISGTLAISGLGPKIAILIDLASGGTLWLALLLTMVAAIILGMGLPTTAAYLILATVVAPALVKLGMPTLTAHFFVFYYGCISTITPPVALAAYVAAGIAGSDINKVGWTAASYGLTSYFLPFAFCFGPGLLLQGTTVENLVAVITATAGTFAIAIGVVGCFNRPLTWPLRALALAAGALLLFQGLATAIVGALLLAALFAADRMRLQPGINKI
ncbi:TRAP transporter fused permease subunit [Nitratireductor sp. XY-223]|uniref:TRAP transporter permease n=1 Tax=Nitratireductor sp. XY-223 TaxID=2561926 RepID=UPI0010AA05F4|nr:TRAP transporter fused permease subunit [Nitratireductor sp. XY-223]